MKTELLVMAAGMGSRFGGLKQIAPMGPNGEIILDFSVYDAKKAGFDKVVFIIKKAIEKEFREACGKRIEKMIDVDYAFQEIGNIPSKYTVPETREKPWGTGQAVLAARDKIDAPFGVVNADDFYGRTSYQILHDHLVSSNEMCMVGYRLGNTITENGAVTRGICTVKDGYLSEIKETGGLDKNCGVPLDSVVSMNMWGLDTGIFDYLEEGFDKFLSENINEPKKEYLLPEIINQRMIDKNMKVKVLDSLERWFGVTYKEDTPSVQTAMKKLISEGMYD